MYICISEPEVDDSEEVLKSAGKACVDSERRRSTRQKATATHIEDTEDCSADDSFAIRGTFKTPAKQITVEGKFVSLTRLFYLF